MVRTALISFFVGLLLVILGVAVADLLSSRVGKSAGESWSYEHIRVVKGLPKQASKATAVQFDVGGQAIIEVNARQVAMQELPLLHLRFRERSDALAMIVSWRSDASGEGLQYRRIGFSPDPSFWLDMAIEPGWKGSANTLAVVFLGPPGGSVILESIELLPPAFPYSLYSTVAQWAAFFPWQHSSVNSYIGVSSPNTLLPVSAIVVLLVASISVYLTAVLVFKNWLSFRWSVVGLLFLLSWMTLDLFWQSRLLRQAELTHQTYAGKTPVEKRQAGGDRELYNLISAAHSVIDVPDARILVSSASDYNGMRGAYYLYPKNVFWKRHARTLPDPKHVQKGDYILLLEPSAVTYDATGSYLRYGATSQLKVRLLLSSGVGSLYQVI